MTPALSLLVRARVARRNIKRGEANAREEYAGARAVEVAYGAGSAYEAGYSVGVSAAAREKALAGIVRRLRGALQTEGLPEDLRPLIEAALTESGEVTHA